MSRSNGRFPTPTPNLVALHHLRLFHLTWNGYHGPQSRGATILAATPEEAIDSLKPHVEPVKVEEIESLVHIHLGKKAYYHAMIDEAD